LFVNIEFGESEKLILNQMGCPALGVSVAFLKQPTLPDKAPQIKKKF
jgi:hypothetical protein